MLGFAFLEGAATRYAALAHRHEHAGGRYDMAARGADGARKFPCVEFTPKRSLVREPRSRCRPGYGSAGTAKISPSPPKTVQSPWLASHAWLRFICRRAAGPTARSITARLQRRRRSPCPGWPPQRDCESPPAVGYVQGDDPDRASLTVGGASSHAPDVPPYSQHRPSLPVASRGPRSTVQHWTAPIIGHHLERDPLVMRRSPNADTG